MSTPQIVANHEEIPHTPRPARRPLTSIVRQNVAELALVPVLIIAVIVGSAANSTFLTSDNILNVLSQSSVLGVLVVAQTLVLLLGRIDLSVESTVTLAPLVAVWLMVTKDAGGTGFGLDPYLGILVTLLIGVIIGVVNGLLVVKVRLNAFVVTLAMLILLRGLASGVAQGKSLFNLPSPYLYLGAASWFGIPLPIWVAGALFLAVALFLRYHRTGRAMYAIGGNEEAARAAGIRVDRVVLGVYVVVGVLAAIAGLLLAGRLAATTANQGQNLVFSVLAACVIGGISLNGGRGRLLGALTGVLLLGVVQNILVLSNIASYWIDATYGLIILIALILTRVAGGKDTM